MTKRIEVIMKTCELIVILVSYCVCSASSYHSRPLNERSPDLTWEAWLLVDDQNQNKQLVNADGMLRRRITPKSIFVAPTFSPESLPPCADGYSSDMLGRCVKIIKLDQDAHYEFLIEKLKEKFSPSDYDYEEEEISTAGPLQVNIPFVFMLDIEEEPTADVGKTTSATTENQLIITTDANTASEKQTTSSPKPEVSHMTSYLNLVRFPDDAKVLPYHQVTFPDSDGTFRDQFPSSGTHIVSSRESSIKDNLQNSSGQSDDPVVFREVDYNTGRQIPATTTHRIFNRRNRDRHNGLFFPRWSQSSFKTGCVEIFEKERFPQYELIRKSGVL